MNLDAKINNIMAGDIDSVGDLSREEQQQCFAGLYLKIESYIAKKSMTTEFKFTKFDRFGNAVISKEGDDFIVSFNEIFDFFKRSFASGKISPVLNLFNCKSEKEFLTSIKK